MIFDHEDGGVHLKADLTIDHVTGDALWFSVGGDIPGAGRLSGAPIHSDDFGLTVQEGTVRLDRDAAGIALSASGDMTVSVDLRAGSPGTWTLTDAALLADATDIDLSGTVTRVTLLQDIDLQVALVVVGGRNSPGT